MNSLAKKSGYRKLIFMKCHARFSVCCRTLLSLSRNDGFTRRPVVLCYSSFTPPTPACNVLFELTPAYEGDFTLLDQVSVTDLDEAERAKIEGIVCTGGYARTDHKLAKKIMSLLPNLKVIRTPSTGINNVDVQAATDRGVRVGRSPGHFQGDAVAVAEFAFGLQLASARSIVLANKVARTTVVSSDQVSTTHIFIFSILIQYVESFEIGVVGWVGGREGGGRECSCSVWKHVCNIFNRDG